MSADPIASPAEIDVREAGAARQRPEDERWMRLAIDEAWRGLHRPGGGEVGAVIVRDGRILAVAHNQAEMDSDPTAHAEMVAIRRACAQLGCTDLAGATIYCTLQCCGMCTMACLWAKVSRIVYGASRRDVHDIYFEEKHWNTADFVRDAFREDLEVVGGVLAEECARLYYGRDEPVPESHQPWPTEATGIPAVRGVIESAIYVTDLDRSLKFYRDLFGFEEIFREGQRMAALSVAGRQVFLLFTVGASLEPTHGQGGVIPPHDAQGRIHFAFAVDAAEYHPWLARLEQKGVPIESEVHFPSGGHSVYFRDPDGNLAELITPGAWPIY